MAPSSRTGTKVSLSIDETVGRSKNTEFAKIIIIITDLYIAFRSEDTEALDAAQED